MVPERWIDVMPALQLAPGVEHQVWREVYRVQEGDNIRAVPWLEGDGTFFWTLRWMTTRLLDPRAPEALRPRYGRRRTLGPSPDEPGRLIWSRTALCEFVAAHGARNTQHLITRCLLGEVTDADRGSVALGCRGLVDAGLEVTRG
jgi:hypothetical protein